MTRVIDDLIYALRFQDDRLDSEVARRFRAGAENLCVVWCAGRLVEEPFLLHQLEAGQDRLTDSGRRIYEEIGTVLAKRVIAVGVEGSIAHGQLGGLVLLPAPFSWWVCVLSIAFPFDVTDPMKLITPVIVAATPLAVLPAIPASQVSNP